MFSVLSDTSRATELFASFVLFWIFVVCLVFVFFPCVFLSVAVWMEADFMEADLSPEVELRKKTK